MAVTLWVLTPQATGLVYKESMTSSNTSYNVLTELLIKTYFLGQAMCDALFHFFYFVLLR